MLERRVGTSQHGVGVNLYKLHGNNFFQMESVDDGRALDREQTTYMKSGQRTDRVGWCRY